MQSYEFRFGPRARVIAETLVSFSLDLVGIIAEFSRELICIDLLGPSSLLRNNLCMKLDKKKQELWICYSDNLCIVNTKWGHVIFNQFDTKFNGIDIDNQGVVWGLTEFGTINHCNSETKMKTEFYDYAMLSENKQYSTSFKDIKCKGNYVYILNSARHVINVLHLSDNGTWFNQEFLLPFITVECSDILLTDRYLLVSSGWSDKIHMFMLDNLQWHCTLYSKYPRGMACDPLQNIWVCENTTSRIKIMDAKGNHLYYLDLKDLKGQVITPIAIELDWEHSLVYVLSAFDGVYKFHL